MFNILLMIKAVLDCYALKIKKAIKTDNIP